jgi:hypothetical protein
LARRLKSELSRWKRERISIAFSWFRIGSGQKWKQIFFSPTCCHTIEFHVLFIHFGGQNSVLLIMIMSFFSM